MPFNDSCKRKRRKISIYTTLIGNPEKCLMGKLLNKIILAYGFEENKSMLNALKSLDQYLTS